MKNDVNKKYQSNTIIIFVNTNTINLKYKIKNIFPFVSLYPYYK